MPRRNSTSRGSTNGILADECVVDGDDDEGEGEGEEASSQKRRKRLSEKNQLLAGCCCAACCAVLCCAVCCTTFLVDLRKAKSVRSEL